MFNGNFLFFVSLEIKRILQGELSNLKFLPIIGAVGGMVVPALFYIFINYSNSATLNGNIPSATDIAFSLGVLYLVKEFISLKKVFLTALAIIDDLGAIVIIAFYSGNIQSTYIVLMLLSVIILIGLNKFKINNFLPYLIVGIFYGLYSSVWN